MSYIKRVLPFVFGAFLGALAAPAPAAAAQEGVAGVYFSVKLGWQHGVGKKEIEPSPLFFDRSTKDGFVFGAAAGVKLDYQLPVWFSTDLELGFQRKSIGVVFTDPSEPDKQQVDRTQTIFFMGNGAVHFLDIGSPHDLFMGAGMGGGFTNGTLTQNRDDRGRFSGADFLMQLSVGYDYRFLQRSQFSNETLSIGVTGRYFHAEGFRREQMMQVLGVITYGF